VVVGAVVVVVVGRVVVVVVAAVVVVVVGRVVVVVVGAVVVVVDTTGGGTVVVDAVQFPRCFRQDPQMEKGAGRASRQLP
jgi:hypothetical protein